MPRRSTQFEQEPGERDWLEQNQAHHFAEFGKLLSQKSYGNRWSQQELARRAGVHQTTISRAERGVLANMFRPTALALMRAYEFGPDEEATWLRTLFDAPPTERDLTQILHPQIIERQFDFHLRRGIRQYPENSVQFGKLFGELLEEVARGSVSASDQSLYRQLSKKARLIEAWGRILISSSSELSIPRDALRSIVESPEDEIYPLARSLIISMETMMQGENVCDPAELESIIRRSRKVDPYVTSLLFQELATQYIYSPTHTMQHVKKAVHQGKRYCEHDPTLRTQMIRLDVLYAVGIFMKVNDPRTGAELMSDVIAQLRMPEHNNPIFLIEALGFAAQMVLYADISPRQATRMLAEAYQHAERIRSSHLSEWIVVTATTFGVSLRIDEPTSL